MRRMHALASEPGLRSSLRVLAIALMGCLVPLAPAAADSDAERELLTQIAHELAALAPLLREAESQANPDVRIRFRYDWLRQDLARVILGVEEHVNAPRAEPRTFPPLRGDYRR